MGSRDLQLLTDDIYSIRESFESMLVDPSIKFEREAEFAVQILAGNDYLLRLAKEPAGKGSLLASVHNVAAIGISLNPAKKQAYLVPRKGKLCLDISWMGLIDLAVSSGSILWAQCHLVYESEAPTFEVAGFDQPPVHKRNPFAKDRGEVVGAYCVAKFPSGDYITEAMSIDEINAIRDRSEAWKKYMADSSKKCPWNTDPGEMQRKTVVKRASKWWADADKSGRVQQAIHHLNTDAEEGLAEINERAAKRPSAPVAPPALKADAEAAAGKGMAAYQAFWKATAKENRALLLGEHERLKDVAAKADAARTIDNEPREPGSDEGEEGRQ